jgi:16S rRNA (cytosine1402-N4)-methyltransferase
VNRVFLPVDARAPARAILSPSAEASHTSPLSAYGRRRCPGRPPRVMAGGLGMTRAEHYAHIPVMLDEVVGLMAETPQGVLVDATAGGGGHATALLGASPRHRLIGIDRDPEAVAAAAERLEPFGPRSSIVHGRFDQMAEILDEQAPGLPVTGILFDLGVSSWQFDAAERGFSYRFDAPLDMRMNPADPVTAADIVNGWAAEDLARLFAEHGEKRFSAAIARAVVRARPLVTTGQLAEVVRSAIPAAARHRGGHPAKRVFQALRVRVNSELEVLGPAIDQAIGLLAAGGRLVVISYHSGEDRLVKARLSDAASGWCTCPPGLPCVCGAVPAVRLLNRGARLASRAEVASNPRASSARLRAAERLESQLRRPGTTTSEEV